MTPQIPVDPYVQQFVAGTNGQLYAPVIGKLKRYPIPRWPGPVARDGRRRLLDIGCGWGRWMVSAARAGFEPTGVDIKQDAAAAANRVLKAHAHRGNAIAAELTRFPFPDEHFDAAFSYSVLQHVPRGAAKSCLSEIYRVLKPGGWCLIELPLRPGLTNWRHPDNYSEDMACWDVRYYRPEQVRDLFAPWFGGVSLQCDCILGIGAKLEDLDVIPFRYRPLVLASELFRRVANHATPLVRWSDSVYVFGHKTGSKTSGG